MLYDHQPPPVKVSMSQKGLAASVPLIQECHERNQISCMITRVSLLAPRPCFMPKGKKHKDLFCNLMQYENSWARSVNATARSYANSFLSVVVLLKH